MLFVFSTCRDLIRTIPMLIHDAAHPEDLDTAMEDHLADCLRYLVLSRPYRSRLNGEIVDPAIAKSPISRQQCVPLLRTPRLIIGMRLATEPPPTLAELIHRLEMIRLAALLHGDYDAADMRRLTKPFWSVGGWRSPVTPGTCKGAVICQPA